MTDKELSLKIAEKIFDQIERDKTLILQSIADIIMDELLLHKAKEAHPVEPRIESGVTPLKTADAGQLERMRKIISDSMRENQKLWQYFNWLEAKTADRGWWDHG